MSGEGGGDCVVVGEHIVPLAGEGPWMLRCDAQRVSVSRRGSSFEVVDLDGGPLLLRGERRARQRVEVGDALAAGRTQLLMAQRIEPRTVLWQGMLATAVTSLLLLADIARAAGSRAPVLLAGESGTGKELAARAIHAAGERRDKPFAALNCAALPEALAESELFGVERGAYTGATRSRVGAFVQTHGGTLFLDEVGELSPLVQAKLLRALECGEVQPVGAARAVKCDVRVVAASWRDLESDAHAGRFRHDLYHRLCVLRVDLLPLRARRDDILPLARSLLEAHGVEELELDPGLARLLVAAPWHGNVRELKNGVLRAAATRDPRAMLPLEAVRRSGARAPRDQERQRDVLEATLMYHRGNRVRSASSLGISRSTLYRWMAARRDDGGEVQAMTPEFAGDGLTAPMRRL